MNEEKSKKESSLKSASITVGGIFILAISLVLAFGAPFMSIFLSLIYLFILLKYSEPSFLRGLVVFLLVVILGITIASQTILPFAWNNYIAKYFPNFAHDAYRFVAEKDINLASKAPAVVRARAEMLAYERIYQENKLGKEIALAYMNGDTKRAKKLIDYAEQRMRFLREEMLSEPERKNPVKTSPCVKKTYPSYVEIKKKGAMEIIRFKKTCVGRFVKPVSYYLAPGKIVYIDAETGQGTDVLFNIKTQENNNPFFWKIRRRNNWNNTQYGNVVLPNGIQSLYLKGGDKGNYLLISVLAQNKN